MAIKGITAAKPSEKFEKSQTPDGAVIDITAGVDSQVADLVSTLSQDVELPDDPDYEPVRFAEDADKAPVQQVQVPKEYAAQANSLVEQLKVLAMPTEVVAMIKQMQDTFAATVSSLQSQIDVLGGRRQSAASRRSPVIEDMLSTQESDYVVVVTGRYKFGNKRYDLLQPGAIVTLPKVFGDRLRRSQCVKRPDELYDMV